MTKNATLTDRELDRIERTLGARKSAAQREAILRAESNKAIKELAASFSTRALKAIVDPRKVLRNPNTGVEIAPANDDHGPRERLRHDGVAVEGNRLPHARILSGSVIDRMLHRGELASDDDEARRLWNAAERLRSTFRIAYADPSVTMDLERIPGGQLGSISDLRVDAQRKLKRVRLHLGPAMFEVLENVIRYDKTASQAMKPGFKKRSVMDMVRWCLEELAECYGV